jgi:hypothetical protein
MSDLVDAMHTYWYEILMRSHLTAITSILRSRRWIDGVVSAAMSKNLLSFAATLRGLIESAADTQTALMSIPSTLARDHSMINSALLGKADMAFVAPKLGESLIHYAYARKIQKGEIAPDSHHARQIREYVEILEKGQVPRVIDCYAALRSDSPGRKLGLDVAAA